MHCRILHVQKKRPLPRTVKRGFLYRLYEARLKKEIDTARLPRHVAVIVDGNRRWARIRQREQAGFGHRAGARKVLEFLRWCREAGIETVTLYLLSSDNLRQREDVEIAELCRIIARLTEEISVLPWCRVKHVGALAGLPSLLAEALRRAEAAAVPAGGEDRSGATFLQVNLAVGYGGRSEITQAVRGVIEEHKRAGGDIDSLAENLTPELIGEHLWTRGQADPELVIRTSGEQRISDFMIWQSAHSEFYFVEALYPDLRKIDFLRALRDYSGRQRRLGR